MNIALSILAVVVLTTGIIISWRDESRSVSVNSPAVKEEVLSEQHEDVEYDDSLISQTPTVIITPTSTSIDTPTDSPTLSNSFTFAEFIYPNASVTAQTTETVVMESIDNTTVVTDWYKDAINRQGMNVTSFVVTSTNDTVLNKLAAADGSREIQVSITKEPNTNVLIEVNLQ